MQQVSTQVNRTELAEVLSKLFFVRPDFVKEVDWNEVKDEPLYLKQHGWDGTEGTEATTVFQSHDGTYKTRSRGPLPSGGSFQRSSAFTPTKEAAIPLQTALQWEKVQPGELIVLHTIRKWYSQPGVDELRYCWVPE